MTNSTKGVALVTGASSGIGATYAERVARRGYDLLLVARNRDKLDAVAEHIRGAYLQSVTTASADLNNGSDLRRIETMLRENRDIFLLVNKAGVGAVKPLLESDPDEMEAMIGLNITALTRLTYAAVPSFVARGGGSIINVASIVGIAPEILNGVYGGTKAYVLVFSRSLHEELSDQLLDT
jgi:short-subunit dehydrogenase